VWVFDMSPKAVDELVQEEGGGSRRSQDFVKKLAAPRAVWLMVPAAVVDKTTAEPGAASRNPATRSIRRAW